MCESIMSGLLYVFVDIDFDIVFTREEKVKSLLELSSEKLISDVCLLRKNSCLLPRSVHTGLLEKALEKGRTLSISELLKNFPEKKFVLPLPSPIRNHDMFIRSSKELSDSLKALKDNALSSLLAFFDIIQEKCANTNLRVLDLNNLPMHSAVVQKVCTFLLNYKGRCTDSAPYEIRLGCIVECSEELEKLNEAKEAAKNTNIKLVVPSLLLSYDRFLENYVMSFLDEIDENELLLFSFHFAAVGPSLDETFLKLQKFQNIRALSLTYMPVKFKCEPTTLSCLSETINGLPNLSRIRLNGNNLSKCMHILFKHFCAKDFSRAKRQKFNSDCCIVHRGKLRCLDVSSCDLMSDDLTFLTEHPLAATLRSLDISHNRLDSLWLSELVSAMSKSLVLLQVEKSLPKSALQNEHFPKFSIMNRLKYLNLRGLDSDEAQLFRFISTEVKKMSSLIGISLSKPQGINNCDHLESLVHSEQNVKFLWEERRS